MAGKKLVVGLGNPGREYQKNRHNLGFMAVAAFAGKLQVEFKKCRYAQALTAGARSGQVDVVFALPQTYMNNSGFAVRDIAAYENIVSSDIIIVADDIHLDFGALRLRIEGSHGGHNGLKSILAQMATSDFAHLRLGVGKPPTLDRQVDYVLSDFTSEEVARMGAFIEDAAGCLKLWVEGQSAEAMTKYNKRKVND